MRLAFCCLLARGHLLIEDIPGVGKTTLAHALAPHLRPGIPPRPVHQRPAAARRHPRHVDLRSRLAAVRLSSGPGLLADAARRRGQPRHAQGPERALLESMEEGQVTIEGVRPSPAHALLRHRHAEPAAAGRHLRAARVPARPLSPAPGAWLPGAPGREGDARRPGPARPHPRAAAHGADRRAGALAGPGARAACLREAIRDYILDLVEKSRQLDGQGVGLSPPRAGLALQRSAQAWAFAAGRAMVVPEDVQAVAPSVMAHQPRPCPAPPATRAAARWPTGSCARSRCDERPAAASDRGCGSCSAPVLGLHVACGGQLHQQPGLRRSLPRRRADLHLALPHVAQPRPGAGRPRAHSPGACRAGNRDGNLPAQHRPAPGLRSQLPADRERRAGLAAPASAPLPRTTAAADYRRRHADRCRPVARGQPRPVPVPCAGHAQRVSLRAGLGLPGPW